MNEDTNNEASMSEIGAKSRAYSRAEEATGLSISDLEHLVMVHTSFKTFWELLRAPGGYRPTFECVSAGSLFNHWSGRVMSARKARKELTRLADAYDAAQEAIGSDRRVFRC